MRAVVALAVTMLAACGGTGDCEVDADCGGGRLCTRNGECLPISDVRAVRITWTVRGAPASDASCAASPSLYLLLFGVDVNDSFGYAPVPCNAGLFVIDKIPRRFVSVELGIEGRFQADKPFDSQGNASFDLVP